jgi:hypothetical protein
MRVLSAPPSSLSVLDDDGRDQEVREELVLLGRLVLEGPVVALVELADVRNAPRAALA